MMKNYSLNFRTILVPVAVLFGIAGMDAQVSVFPWTETFEDTSPTRDAWTQIYEVNTMAWTFVAQPSTGGTGVVAYEGTKMANYPATSHNFDKTKLVSPVLDLSAAASATVSFHYRNPYWNPDQNWLRVFYRTSAESPWVQLAEYHSHVPSWTSSGTINLPTPTATYQIAVECETDYGYSTTFDALVVSTTALSAAQHNALTASYYPNPAGDKLYFSANGQIDEVAVYNYLGQLVSVFKVGLDQGHLDISNLYPGQYVIRAQGEKGSNTFKLVKK